MVCYIILQSPKRRKCRHRNHNISAWSEDPINFMQRGVVVLDMLHCIGCEDDIKLPFCKRQVCCLSQENRTKALCQTITDRQGVNIDTNRVSITFVAKHA